MLVSVFSRYIQSCSMVYYIYSHSFNLNVTLFTITLQADHAIANMNEFPMFPAIYG